VVLEVDHRSTTPYRILLDHPLFILSPDSLPFTSFTVAYAAVEPENYRRNELTNLIRLVE
jgi:hypothetical protein